MRKMVPKNIGLSVKCRGLKYNRIVNWVIVTPSSDVINDKIHIIRTDFTRYLQVIRFDF